MERAQQTMAGDSVHAEGLDAIRDDRWKGGERSMHVERIGAALRGRSVNAGKSAAVGGGMARSPAPQDHG